jgi:hypothetical protein
VATNHYYRICPGPAAKLRCSFVPGVRGYGGGYMTGTQADGLQPYPLIVARATECAQSCSDEPACRSYVLVGSSCYRWGAYIRCLP